MSQAPIYGPPAPKKEFYGPPAPKKAKPQPKKTIKFKNPVTGRSESMVIEGPVNETTVSKALAGIEEATNEMLRSDPEYLRKSVFKEPDKPKPKAKPVKTVVDSAKEVKQFSDKKGREAIQKEVTYQSTLPGPGRGEGLEFIPLPPMDSFSARSAIREKTDPHKTMAQALGAPIVKAAEIVNKVAAGTNKSLAPIKDAEPRRRLDVREGAGDVVHGMTNPITTVEDFYDPKTPTWAKGLIVVGAMVPVAKGAGAVGKTIAKTKGFEKIAKLVEKATSPADFEKVFKEFNALPAARQNAIKEEVEAYMKGLGDKPPLASKVREKPFVNPVTEAMKNAKSGKPKSTAAPAGTTPVATKVDQPKAKTAPLKSVSEEADVTAARNASQNISRVKMGLDELPETERKSFVESLDAANKSGEKNKSYQKAEALLKEKNPRAWTDEESAGATIRQRELENEADDLAKRIEANPDDIEAANTLNAVHAEYGIISDALKKVGTQAARTLAIRRLGLQPNYKPIVIKARIKALTGKDVDAKAAKTIDDLTKRLREAEESVVRLENEANTASAIDTVKVNSKRATQFTKEEADKELSDILAEFKTSRMAAGSFDAQTAVASAVIDVSKLVGKVALNYTKRGISTLDEVVVKTIQFAKEHFGVKVSEDEVIKHMTEVNQRTKKELTDEVAALKKNQINVKRDAKAYAENKQKIATLEQKIQNEFSDLPRKPKRNPGKIIEDQRARIVTLKKELETIIEERRSKTVLEKVTNVVGAPRSIASSFDISAPGRQGWLLALAHPQHAVKAFGHQVRALLSEDYASKVANKIKERENFVDYDKDGLYLSELSTSTTAREEAFKSRLFSKWTKFNPIRASERAYTTYLNFARAEAYDTMRKALPDATEAERKSIANWVNVASGRGGIEAQSAVGKSMEAMAGVLFSPRYQTSRLQVLALQPLYGGSGRSRALIAGEYGKVLAAVSEMLLIAEAAGADVSKDPNSSDFLKIKIGDTRIDLGAGLQQYLVLGSRILTQKKTGSDGETQNAPPGLGEKFARSKANPTAGFAYDLTFGGRKNYLGEDLSWKEALNILPMSPKEFAEGLVEDGWGREDALTLLNFFGIGTQTYKPKTEKRERPH